METVDLVEVSQDHFSNRFRLQRLINIQQSFQPNQPKTVFSQQNTKKLNQPSQLKTVDPNRARPNSLISTVSTENGWKSVLSGTLQPNQLKTVAVEMVDPNRTCTVNYCFTSVTTDVKSSANSQSSLGILHLNLYLSCRRLMVSVNGHVELFLHFHPGSDAMNTITITGKAHQNP